MPETYAVLIPSFRPLGVVRVVLALMREFLEHNQDIDLLVGDTGEPSPFPIPDGARVIDLQGIRNGNLVRNLGGYLREVWPNGLLAVTHPANMAAIPARFLAEVTTRVVVSVQMNVSQALQSKPRELEWVANQMREFYPHADGIVAVSDGAADDLANLTRLPRERITVIHNSVVTPELSSLANGPPHHHWFDPKTDPVLLGVGRLAPQKDFVTLIKAFARVRKQKKAKLIILGEGPERANLERLIADLGLAGEVALPGFAPNPFPAMQRASIFVLSSLHEGYPCSLLEAMACGTPVVSTDCPSGPAEMLDQGKYGTLVTMGDDREMATAMLSVLSAPLARSVLRGRAGEFSSGRGFQRYFSLLSAPSQGSK